MVETYVSSTPVSRFVVVAGDIWSIAIGLCCHCVLWLCVAYLDVIYCESFFFSFKVDRDVATLNHAVVDRRVVVSTVLSSCCSKSCCYVVDRCRLAGTVLLSLLIGCCSAVALLLSTANHYYIRLRRL